MDLKDIHDLIAYACKQLELNVRDREYKANRLLEIMQSGLEGAELEDAVYGELSLLPSEVDENYIMSKKLTLKYSQIRSYEIF